MTNEEEKRQLEMALKAVAHFPGFEHPLVFNEDDGQGWYAKLADGVYWRPRTDDGDAFRLAVMLELSIATPFVSDVEYSARYDLKRAGAYDIDCMTQVEVHLDECGGDHCAAVRLAIFRAAASIGKTLE